MISFINIKASCKGQKALITIFLSYKSHLYLIFKLRLLNAFSRFLHFKDIRHITSDISCYLHTLFVPGRFTGCATVNNAPISCGRANPLRNVEASVYLLSRRRAAADAESHERCRRLEAHGCGGGKEKSV